MSDAINANAFVFFATCLLTALFWRVVFERERRQTPPEWMDTAGRKQHHGVGYGGEP